MPANRHPVPSLDDATNTELPFEFASTSDGLVTIRRLGPGDARILKAGRDDVVPDWIERGSIGSPGAAYVVLDGTIVGWVGYGLGHDWLRPGEINVGCSVLPAHRGKGYASRAVQLLVHHLAVRTSHRSAALLLHPDDQPSLALASRTRFMERGEIRGSRYFARSVPPLTYTDGVVTLRRQRAEDLDADIEAKDDEQIDWLWLPGQRESWEAMSLEQQRAHALGGLEANFRDFGTGPHWTFAVDGPDAACVATIDCHLANRYVPRGEANVAYAAHPAHRGRGYVSRAVRLLMQFLRDHTGARYAHLLIDARNVASLRVARAVGAVAGEPWVNDEGRTMVRHVLPLRLGNPSRRRER